MNNPDLSVSGNKPFFIPGGTLPGDAPSYVTRQADHNLLAGLRAGQFCYVLTSRQMGKSSLMVRVAGQLREEGLAVAVLDLTALGQNLTVEQWYFGLLEQLGRHLRPKTNWTTTGRLTSVWGRCSAGWRRFAMSPSTTLLVR